MTSAVPRPTRHLGPHHRWGGSPFAAARPGRRRQRARAPVAEGQEGRPPGQASRVRVHPWSRVRRVLLERVNRGGTNARGREEAHRLPAVAVPLGPRRAGSSTRRAQAGSNSGGQIITSASERSVTRINTSFDRVVTVPPDNTRVRFERFERQPFSPHTEQQVSHTQIDEEMEYLDRLRRILWVLMAGREPARGLVTCTARDGGGVSLGCALRFSDGNTHILPLAECEQDPIVFAPPPGGVGPGREQGTGDGPGPDTVRLSLRSLNTNVSALAAGGPSKKANKKADKNSPPVHETS
jgi:hypothetical protein